MCMKLPGCLPLSRRVHRRILLSNRRSFSIWLDDMMFHAMNPNASTGRTKVNLLIHAGNELRIAYVLLVLLCSWFIKIAIQRSSLVFDFALERIPTSVHASHFSRLPLTLSAMHPICLWHLHSTYCFRWIQNIVSHFLSWKNLEMFSPARRSWKR